MPEDRELAAARRFLDDMDIRAERDEAGEPHSVIAYDPMTKSYTVKGPYPNAHVATLEAEHLKVELNGAAGAPGIPPIQTWIALHLAVENGGYPASTDADTRRRIHPGNPGVGDT